VISFNRLNALIACYKQALIPGLITCFRRHSLIFYTSLQFKMQLKRYSTIISCVLLSAILAFSFLTNLGLVPIRVWDEGRVVTNALNMFLNGDWIVTHYDGKPDMWNTKPPLLICLQAVSMHLFGVSEWSVRFPSAMASIFTGLALWFFCWKYFKDHWLGFLAACVFATTFAYVFNHAGRTGDYDALLTLFTTLYCLSFYLYCRSMNDKWLLYFFILLTLAVLTKGVAGLFMGPALFIYSVIRRRTLSLLKNKWFYAGLAFFLFISVGYYLLRDHFNPGYIKAVLDGELGSFPKTLNNHNHPFRWYFTNIIDWRYSYWFWFVLPAYILGFINPSEKVRSLSLFNCIVVIIYLLILSASHTKLYWYDLPIYPFLALQIGLMLHIIWLMVQKTLRLSLTMQKVIVAFILFSFFFVIPFKKIYHYNKHVSTDWPWDLDVADRDQALFIQQAIRNHQNLNNYTFCYNACERCHAQIDFYVTLLQSKNVHVTFKDNVDSLKVGECVVVSQLEMKKKLESSYLVKKLKDENGCSVYQIVERSL